MKTHSPILPRIIRMRDAPAYLGMNRHYFNKEIRARLQEIAIGKHGIGFDRLDLDAWLDHHKNRSVCPVTKRGKLWDKNKLGQGFEKEIGVSGTSIKQSSVVEFARALAQATSKKRKCSLPNE